jgi:hypothetical protein
LVESDKVTTNGAEVCRVNTVSVLEPLVTVMVRDDASTPACVEPNAVVGGAVKKRLAGLTISACSK